MKHYFLVIWTIACLLIVACGEDYEYQPNKMLVVEGWIDAGGYPVVMVTTSVPISEEKQPLDEMDEYLLRWAKVAISDGEDYVVLTGKIDTCYSIPYIFTTGKMKGVPGKTYHLTVSYEDLYAEAETTIPYPASVDSFSVTPIEGDSLFQLNAFFEDNVSEKDFYKFFVRVKGRDNVLLPAFLGTIDDDVLDKNVKATIYQPNRLFSGEYSPFFRKNDTVSVKISRMDADAYQFWKAYDELQSFSGVMFFPVSHSLPSNVKGGIGYWFGYGSTTYTLDLNSLKCN